MLELCRMCKGEGGCFDCGWWYECPLCHHREIKEKPVDKPVDKPQQSAYNKFIQQLIEEADKS